MATRISQFTKKKKRAEHVKYRHPFRPLPSGAWMAAVEQFIPRSIRHVFLLHSGGVGGVETAISAWLLAMPANVREACMILSRVEPVSELPVLCKGLENRDVIDDILASDVRTVWIQPSIGYAPDRIRRLIDSGRSVYQLIISQHSGTISEVSKSSPTAYVLTSETLEGICGSLDPRCILPHCVRSTAEVVCREKPRRIGYVGRMSREKGIDFLPELLAELRLKSKSAGWRLNAFVPETKSATATNETVKSEFLQSARDLKVLGAITIQADIENVEEIFSKFDVLVIASDYEGYSMVAHEALASGCGVVVPDNLAIATEEAPGLVVYKARDAKDAARAVTTAYNTDPMEIRTAAARHTIEGWRELHLAAMLEMMHEC